MTDPASAPADRALRVSEDEHQVLDEVDDGGSLDAAQSALLDELLERHVGVLADTCVLAVRAFVPHAGSVSAIDPAQCERALEAISQQPRRALALTTVRELVAEAIGAEADGGVDGWIKAQAKEVEVDTDLFALDRALVAWVRGAYPAPSPTATRRQKAVVTPITPAARTLRCALVRDFAPPIRAAALAAEDPAAIERALALVLAHPHDIRAQIEGMAAPRAEQEAKAMAAGPPRRFSWWHVAFAAVIAGLTLYHYLWR